MSSIRKPTKKKSRKRQLEKLIEAKIAEVITAFRQSPDILNEIFANGGHIEFHCGNWTQKFIPPNTLVEEGYWEASDGAHSCRIPFKLTAALGKPKRKEGAL